MISGPILDFKTLLYFSVFFFLLSETNTAHINAMCGLNVWRLSHFSRVFYLMVFTKAPNPAGNIILSMFACLSFQVVVFSSLHALTSAGKLNTGDKTCTV